MHNINMLEVDPKYQCAKFVSFPSCFLVVDCTLIKTRDAMLGPSCTDSLAARQHQPALTHPFVPTEVGPWHSPPGGSMEGQKKLQIVKNTKMYYDELY